MSTHYHSQYWAHALMLKSASDSIDNLSRSIANAKVDLNPHQVDAALFAFRSPLSKGAILADEVGLGKTIEAGIVLAQGWAERKRRILLILPATLRKQWQLELEEKFYLPSVILESRNFNQMRRDGYPNPFDQDDKIVACSYHFASAKAEEISRLPWDLVVVDEAHRLRNVYKTSNKMAKAISQAIEHCRKLLLTATPLQNSLMELFGLASVIDPHVFGDPASFREQFVRNGDAKARDRSLRERLKPLCTRTLRKQVLEYIRFTNRVPILQEFLPSDEEHRLYEEVSAYLTRHRLIALPSRQRKLMTMVLRKLLSSSSFAIAGTLRRLVRRLEKMLAEAEEEWEQKQLEEPLEDYEGLDELEDEWDEETEDDEEIRPEMIREELDELRNYAELAESIEHNAKGSALTSALEIAFERAHGLGAKKKAVIFTESRRTQQYLFDLLNQNGYAGKVAIFNGTNTDPHSREIYQEWKQRHDGEEIVLGSRAIDAKSAIVEEFRDRATLLVATEAAAEGINLQFCSLVVNYDLPWNPQRIEQRIGRCHRYGQEHDVVVVNFLNRRNQADQRVFQLLSEKLRLFDGVFGASDEVLGALESGVDIERRIARVYQECRTSEEIQEAFDNLQVELEEQVQSRMAETRQTLLDNFDEEVHARLKVHRREALATLSKHQQWLLLLTQHELGEEATFNAKKPRFLYTGQDARLGNYNLDWKAAEKRGDSFFRVDHPLAVKLIARAKERKLPAARVTFDYSGGGTKIAILKSFVGQSGYLELSKLTIESFDTEESLIFAARSDDGRVLDEDMCRKLFSLTGRGDGEVAKPRDLSDLRQKEVDEKLRENEERNSQFFDEEVLKLDRWSEDLKIGLEQEIKDLDRQIRESRKMAALAGSLKDKLAAQKTLKELERARNQRRRELFDAQDAIDEKREELILNIEKQLGQRQEVGRLFTIRWTVA